MLSITSTQLDAWLVAFFFPLARILALIATSPVFSTAGVPGTVKLGLGIALTVAVSSALPPMPAISPGSWEGMLLLIQQILIGVAMGFSLRIAFAAIDFAGELIGLQMGLSFAQFYDPNAGGSVSVITQFLGLLAVLIFMSMDGHLMLLQLLVQSFTWWPVGSGSQLHAAAVVSWGASLFSSGLLLALPIITALLIVNLALGVLTRAAPQLNLFAVGFPVTITVGFGLVFLSLPFLSPGFMRVFEQGLNAVGQLATMGAP